jgi:predicted transcriptional regulator
MARGQDSDELEFRDSLILAIHPSHAEAILSGKKTVELRTRFPAVSPGATVYLYATAPVSSIIGGFHVGEVLRDGAERIWSCLQAELNITEQQFKAYLRGQAEVSAICVQRPFRLRRPSPNPELAAVESRYRFPQSFRFLREPVLRLHLRALEAHSTSA